MKVCFRKPKDMTVQNVMLEKKYIYQPKIMEHAL